MTLFRTGRTPWAAVLVGSISGPAFAQEPAPPWVDWAISIGSFGTDGAFGIGADAEGNVYVGGRTDSADLLANAGFDALPDFAGGDDAVVLVFTGSCTIIDSFIPEASGGLTGTFSVCSGAPQLAIPEFLDLADSNSEDGSFCRIPNGSDTDQPSFDWVFSGNLTPGEANIP